MYVHLPFCVHKCPYCDFFSVIGKGEDHDGFLETLLVEAEMRAPEAPATVFFGGGTPSYFSEAQLERLLSRLDEITGFASSATEVTAECNPESLNLEKAQLMLAMGVNRLSVGVQSLNPKTLEFFERPHTPGQALAAVEAVKAAGYERWSADLIHGAPMESPDDIRHNIKSVLDLGADHISAYGLTYEPGTPLHASLERGAFSPQDEDQELENLRVAREVLTESGLKGYEVSNFSTNGQECVHNLNYWANGSYVGLGPSAASHVEGTRSGNARSLARWTRAVNQDGSAPLYTETLEPLERLGETWWLGLRLAKGVSPSAAMATAGWSGPDPTLPIRTKLMADGLLESRGGRVRIPDSGLALADYIGKQFLAPEA
ncbi:MAG: oxygen-independent coproporphyrinogen-3 oxidase [Planctomycetota bacterium]|jgi:oxygen-independent coproporphyrinogen-3 oxidase